MTLSDHQIQKALRIKRLVKDYFESSTESKINANELMNLFIKHKIFDKNRSDGLPIREFLKLLLETNQLNLIPQAYCEDKAGKKYWYFVNKTV